MNNPHIYIVGAGAIGKALAVFLQEEQKAVTLIRGQVDDQPATEEPITVVAGDQIFRQTIRTTTFAHLSAIDGIVLVATKTFANEAIAQKLRQKNGRFSIILLQNGLHIEQAFNDFERVYRCVLFSTSQVSATSEIRFKSVTASPVGSIQSNHEGLDQLIETISTAHFPFRYEPAINKQVWTKVIANCAFNAICPLLETDNGIFHRNPEAARLAKIIIDECVAIAKLQGVELVPEEIEANLLLISQRSDGQLISTYVDLLQRRPTEIESLNLAIARLADEMGVPELVTHTRLLGEMIRLKSVIS